MLWLPDELKVQDIFTEPLLSPERLIIFSPRVSAPSLKRTAKTPVEASPKLNIFALRDTALPTLTVDWTKEMLPELTYRSARL